MRAGFVVTEVLNGFRRNITMTIAMILTTAISLGLLGGGLIIARMTDQMRDIYGDKVEVTIYLTPDLSAQDPDCRASPCQDINEPLQANTDVETIDFESQARRVRAVQAAVRRPAGTAGDRHAGGAVRVVPRQALRPAALPGDRRTVQRQARRAVGGRPERLPGPAVQPAQRHPERHHHRRAGAGAGRAAADLQHGADRRVHPADRDRDHAAGRRVPLAHPAAVHARGGDRRPGRCRRWPSADWSRPSSCSSTRRSGR